MNERLIKLITVAERIGRKSAKSVTRMIDRGELPKAVKVGRTPFLFASDVDAYLEKLKGERGERTV
jgi:predicted DNA-binding transcriptional regulator AlpA